MGGAIEGYARVRAVGGHGWFAPAHGRSAKADSKGNGISELKSVAVAVTVISRLHCHFRYYYCFCCINGLFVEQRRCMAL